MQIKEVTEDEIVPEIILTFSKINIPTIVGIENILCFPWVRFTTFMFEAKFSEIFTWFQENGYSFSIKEIKEDFDGTTHYYGIFCNSKNGEETFICHIEDGIGFFELFFENEFLKCFLDL